MNAPEPVPTRGYYTAAVPPHTSIGRVSANLRRGLTGIPDLGDYVFDFASGALELRWGDRTRNLARGFTGLGKSAFYLSFQGRVPSAAKGFLDNQNLSFLRLRNCGLCVYDLFYLTHPDHYSERLLGKLLYRGMGGYDFYLAISQYTKDSLCDVFQVPAERVRVIPLDCDRNIFRSRAVDRDALLRRLKLPVDRRVLLHVSLGDKRKNLPGILAAFGHVAPSFPDAVLLRVGKPLHAKNHVREQECIRRLGLENSVLQIHGISDEDLAGLYNIADCFVFPSLAEGFGLPVLEAQACGCPCVTSNTTALAEVAGPLCTTVNPLDVLDIANGIATVLRDTDRRTREAEAGRKFLERFNWGVSQKLLREWMA